MSVDYTVVFKNGSEVKIAGRACFGGLKSLDEYKEWEEIPSDTELEQVFYHTYTDLSVFEGTPLAEYVSGEDVVVDGSHEGDAMITIFSIVRYLCEGRDVIPSHIKGMSVSPLRKVLYSELLSAGNCCAPYKQSNNISSDGEETVFDMQRLTLPDAIAAIVVFEKLGKMYKGYQDVMATSDGYVRDEYDCDVGESITGYWQAPVISGGKLGKEEGLGFHHIMASSFYGGGVLGDAFIQNVHTFVEQCLIEAMDSLRSGKWDGQINQWLENPRHDNLPEDARVRNLCLLKQNLQREVHVN